MIFACYEQLDELLDRLDADLGQERLDPERKVNGGIYVMAYTLDHEKEGAGWRDYLLSVQTPGAHVVRCWIVKVAGHPIRSPGRFPFAHRLAIQAFSEKMEKQVRAHIIGKLEIIPERAFIAMPKDYRMLYGSMPKEEA